eukprot:TRINITY_DN311_c0_g2_i1.p1 TRINITY_DN311_c0_g2~~TRINITY_DN311_c0_g2_i1.p1  ORF type:complete len:187 (+),score=32.02 TRINITY_DN311_c0_g2_i1:662-1222(+)
MPLDLIPHVLGIGLAVKNSSCYGEGTTDYQALDWLDEIKVGIKLVKIEIYKNSLYGGAGFVDFVRTILFPINVAITGYSSHWSLVIHLEQQDSSCRKLYLMACLECNGDVTLQCFDTLDAARLAGARALPNHPIRGLRDTWMGYSKTLKEATIEDLRKAITGWGNKYALGTHNCQHFCNYVWRKLA